jgi:anhydro-N-acetylmuramic acid kinase
MKPEILKSIGLMSGTSLDGIDVAVLETDGEQAINAGPSLTIPYGDDFRAKLRGVLGGTTDDAALGAVERELTLLHAAAVETLIARHAVTGVALIGFHGHTILHRPEARQTIQIGDGALLADRLGIGVVSDFRSADVAAGGQGAPLAPAYHWGLAHGLERPLAILNLGGVGNVTWFGAADNEIVAFDTGPGNAMIDDWMLRHTGRPVDQDGALAAAGKVDFDTVQRFLDHPFFGRRPPKSLDRDSFAALMPRDLSIEDGAATLTRATAAAVARARAHLPAPPRRWLVTGGGRHNPTLMAALAEELACPVDPVEAVGWDGDALEAQAFAYLAVRSLRGRPLSFPGTTGVPAPLSGGRIDWPGFM